MNYEHEKYNRGHAYKEKFDSIEETSTVLNIKIMKQNYRPMSGRLVNHGFVVWFERIQLMELILLIREGNSKLVILSS